MVRAIQHWVVVLLLAVSISTPWTVLQSVAWFGMVVKYSHQAGLSRAIAMTFDGKHPCRLCHIVQQEQNKDRQAGKETFAPEKQLDWGLPLPEALLWHPPRPKCAAMAVSLAEPRPERPPIPPPRFG